MRASRFIRGDQLYTANVGDSRAIMATMTEEVRFASQVITSEA
eukprot:SAG31_NODE_44931_length_260_cov_1.925466_1_plen_42_part_10